MRIFSLITTLAVLATTVAGVALPRQDNCGYEVGCDFAQAVSKRETSLEHAARSPQELTNAELIRRGLPLKSPIMRRGTPVRRSSPSGKPNLNHKHDGKTHRGTIRVRRASDNAILGYVSSVTLNHAQYLYGDAASALIVTFETDKSGSGTKLDIATENSDIPGYLLGLVQGRDNKDSVLAAGSYQYTYLAGTNQTPPGSVPVVVGNSYGPTRTSESAVWTYDHGTGALAPYWVNPDKSYPKVQFFVQGTAIYIGGDSVAFNAQYPSPVTHIIFEFVSLW